MDTMNDETRDPDPDISTPPSDVDPVPPPRLDSSVPDVAPRSSRKGGRGLAGLLAVSVLSAVLASAGTVAVLETTILNAPAASTPAANGRTVTVVDTARGHHRDGRLGA